MNELTLHNIKAALASDSTRRILELPNFARAAVLVPVVSAHNSLELLFTRRTHTVETHKGQVSFPGGMVDASDNDIIQTALREADEEIGLPARAVEIIGMLDDMATPTRFVITPVVGMIEHLPPLAPNADEVEEVFCVPLTFFSDESNARSEMRSFNGKEHEVWFYDYDGNTIWGVTAVIVRALVSKLNSKLSK